MTTDTSPVGSANKRHPLVGVGVLVLREGRVLLGQRKGSHGPGTWALPGGHLEFGETVAQCAVREVLEETGLRINAVTPAPYKNDVFEAEGKHYVTLFVAAHSAVGEAALCEPDKCSEWRWFRWSELPAPLFQPLATLHASGFAPDFNGPSR